MTATVGSKYNPNGGFCSGGFFSIRWLAACLAAVLIIGPSVRAEPAMASTEARWPYAEGWESMWDESVWDMLETIYLLLWPEEIVTAGVANVQSGLIDLTNYWAELGVRADLTPEEAAEVLAAVDELEYLLVSEPERTDPLIRAQALSTLCDIRSSILEGQLAAAAPGGVE